MGIFSLRRRLSTQYQFLCAAGLAAFAFLAVSAGGAQAQTGDPTIEEMRRALVRQQQMLDDLTRRLNQTEERLEATGDMVEQGALAASAGGAPGWWQRTSVGGYGELHYNGGDADEIDFHRFVLFFGHEFTDRLRLFSEVELEHALSGEGKDGEVELEQAFIEFDIDDDNVIRGGVFLLPVGILNETHEPPTFYGVERNSVESNIIPTTWWEAGGGFTTRFAEGFALDLAVHSGLEVPTTGGNAFKIRNGRQKVSEATAKDGAYTGRLKWTGIPGVELAVSGQYQSDLTQGAPGFETEAFLFEGHADIRRGPFGLRALYARWDLDSAAAEAVGRDEQYGWYLEPSYRFFTEAGDLGFFVRYSQWDNEAGDAVPDRKFKKTDVGFNFWPHPDVVLKLDYQFEDTPAGTADDDRVNLGIGFQF